VHRLIGVLSRLAEAVRSSAILDWLAAVLTLTATLLRAVNPHLRSPSWFMVAATVVAAGSLAWRRRRPEAVLVVGLAASFAGVSAIPVMLALGTVAAMFGQTRRTWFWTFASAACVLGDRLWAHGLVRFGEGRALTLLYYVGFVVGLPILVGLYIDSRRRLLAMSRAETALLAATRLTEIEKARLAERARIAREMHDVVAHRVGLISLQAGGLEVSQTDPKTAEAAGVIRRTAHEALEELRQVVGVLRSDDGSATEAVTPQPGLTDLKELIDGWKAAGVDVQLDDDTDAQDADDVSTTTGRTVYRVVEEALTNASKHASGAPVSVTLRRKKAELSVAVANGPGVAVSSRAVSGAGYGLLGLKERVQTLGGSIEGAPDVSGGFVLQVNLPVGRAE
jgi:signal transduction histidine kinase